MNYVECINMDHMSPKKTIIQHSLMSKSVKMFNASFDKYVKVEFLEGDSLRERDYWPLNLLWPIFCRNLNRLRFTPKGQKEENLLY